MTSLSGQAKVCYMDMDSATEKVFSLFNLDSEYDPDAALAQALLLSQEQLNYDNLPTITQSSRGNAHAASSSRSKGIQNDVAIHTQPTRTTVEEDDIDPDNLSYEELLALEEAMGNEGKGLSFEQISVLPILKYEAKLSKEYCKTERCVICCDDYIEDEDVMALPCDHLFHKECIKIWLHMSKICPICNHKAIVKGN